MASLKYPLNAERGHYLLAVLSDGVPLNDFLVFERSPPTFPSPRRGAYLGGRPQYELSYTDVCQVKRSILVWVVSQAQSWVPRSLCLPPSLKQKLGPSSVPSGKVNIRPSMPSPRAGSGSEQQPGSAIGSRDGFVGEGCVEELPCLVVAFGDETDTGVSLSAGDGNGIGSGGGRGGGGDGDNTDGLSLSRVIYANHALGQFAGRPIEHFTGEDLARLVRLRREGGVPGGASSGHDPFGNVDQGEDAGSGGRGLATGAMAVDHLTGDEAVTGAPAGVFQRDLYLDLTEVSVCAVRLSRAEACFSRGYHLLFITHTDTHTHKKRLNQSHCF